MSIELVRNYFSSLGIEDRIMEFPISSATVDLAAKAVGVEGARICKTLSFQGKDKAILIQTAGDTKINNGKFKSYFGFKAKMLSPDDVLKYTGHSIGGVCAFGVDFEKVDVYCDTSLKRFETIFPACGSSNSAIEFTPCEIFEISKAKEWIDVSKIIEEAK